MDPDVVERAEALKSPPRREIYVHKHAYTRAKAMLRSNIFNPQHRPSIIGDVTIVNEAMVKFQAEGRQCDLDKLDLYCRGLSDAFHYCVGPALGIK